MSTINLNNSRVEVPLNELIGKQLQGIACRDEQIELFTNQGSYNIDIPARYFDYDIDDSFPVMINSVSVGYRTNSVRYNTYDFFELYINHDYDVHEYSLTWSSSIYGRVEEQVPIVLYKEGAVFNDYSDLRDHIYNELAGELGTIQAAEFLSLYQGSFTNSFNTYKRGEEVEINLTEYLNEYKQFKEATTEERTRPRPQETNNPLPQTGVRKRRRPYTSIVR